MRQTLATSFAVAALLGAALLSGAQQPPPPPEEPEEEFRLRIEVEIVNVPLIVRDRRGEFIYNLTRDEVTVYDNGVPQQLLNFELAERPLSAVILLDTSRRVAPLLDRVRKTGVLFTDYILGQLGEAAILTFDSEVTLHQKFSSDADELIRSVESIQAGGGETRLADALDRGVSLLAERSDERRRVIIVVSEPLDTGSRIPLGVPLREAQLRDITIYSVALNIYEAELRRRPEDTPAPRSPYPPGVFPAPGNPGSVQTPGTQTTTAAQGDILSAIIALVRGVRDVTGANALEVVARGTGGLNVPVTGQAALEQALNLLGQDIHNQYMLAYRPSNREESGFHEIHVEVRRAGVRTRTRPGYYVGLPPIED